MAITNFTDNGRDGTKKNFFANAMATMEDASFEDVYGKLAPVLARQFVNYPDTPINPLTNAFMDEALEYGSIIQDVFVNATPMKATKTALADLGDATDELGFADVGMRVSYATINTANTCKVSKFENELRKASMDVNVAGSLADSIIESLRVGAVAGLENQVNKVLVSSIPMSNAVYTGYDEDNDDASAKVKKMRKTIVDTALEMSKVNDSFVQSVGGSKYADGKANEVMVIAPKETWAAMTMDLSGIYHPELLMFDEFKKMGVNITPVMIDDFQTPVTSAEAGAYTTASGITWDSAPGGNNEKPDFIICDKRYFRINPYIDRYIMRSTQVNANLPYTNFFLHMQNAISYQPNRKAAIVYNTVDPDA